MSAPTVPAPSGAAAGVRANSRRELDAMVARLRENARAFARLSIAQRIRLLRAMQAGYLAVARASVEAACAAKGIPPGTPLEGEEWATGPWSVVRHLRLLTESLRSIERSGTTTIGPLGRTIDGRLTVRVFPAGRVDGVLFSGITVENHLQAGWDERRLEDARAPFYRHSPHDGMVTLVLGAGNLACIAPMDVLTKMFNEGMVCVLKMSPVNAWLGPFLERAFAPAVSRGFLAVAYGGPEEGTYLAHHEGVDTVHVTGSDKTYETLVWGPPGPERESRKARHTPLLSKPVTAELGNVSPILVVPGPYTDRELAFQAESVVGSAVHNVSFNCNSGKVLVSPAAWAGRATLLQAVERSLAAAPTRLGYYPGTEERLTAITRGRANVTKIGDASEGRLPWTLVTDLDAGEPAEAAFRNEPFCPVLLETAVGSSDPVEYLERAVAFANNRLWGTLSATLVVHPQTMKDPALAAAVEQAIVRLRYGAVAVNSWTGLLFSFASPPWGGHPSSTDTDIQSGMGWVHNTPMVEGVEKAVLRHPVTIVPKPAFFPSHRTAHTLMRRMTALEERASWRRVPGVIGAALRA